MPHWSVLTNHARVLLAVAGDPNLRLREIPDAVGSASVGSVTDLTDNGYLPKQREARRNRYFIHTQRLASATASTCQTCWSCSSGPRRSGRRPGHAAS